MPKALVTFELKGTELTLSGTEQAMNEIIRGLKIHPDVQQIKLVTVTYDSTGTHGSAK